jgi:outer membrane immunogenic protein
LAIFAPRSGGGVEWAFVGNWSLKVEYLYIDLGSLSAQAITSSGVETVNSKFTDNIVRAGLNYQFH